MAEIVLGLGCAHSPQLHTPVEQWHIRAERDTQDGVPLWFHGDQLSYADVLEIRKHQQFETSSVEREAQLERAAAALDTLNAAFVRASPDVAIVFGSDQSEIYLDSLRPAFTIMGSAEFHNAPRTAAQISRLPPGIELADGGHLPDRDTIYPGYPELARHIAEFLTAANFDVAWSGRQYLPDKNESSCSGMPHAYGFISKQIFRDKPVAQVPIDLNACFPPNQPTGSRCLTFGETIGEAIRVWKEDLRVCIIASGGLSHFVVDEEFDRDIMAAMSHSKFEHLLTYHEGYYQAGSSEIKSWIAAGGAMRQTRLCGEIVGYEALYRTPAGTGSSAAFMLWR